MGYTTAVADGDGRDPYLEEKAGLEERLDWLVSELLLESEGMGTGRIGVWALSPLRVNLGWTLGGGAGSAVP